MAIADASPFMQRWLSAALAGLAPAPVLVSDGLDLLFQLGERGPFDLVVADNRLPGLSAAQVLAMARTAGDLTPFLLISPVVDPSLASLVRKTGPASIIQDALDANAVAEAARAATATSGARPRAATAPWRPSFRTLARALGLARLASNARG